MKRAICTIVGSSILIASSSVVFAQDTFDLPLVSAPGDRLLIEYVHKRNKNGQSNTGNIVAEIAIKDVRDESFVASWITRSVEVDGFVIRNVRTGIVKQK